MHNQNQRRIADILRRRLGPKGWVEGGGSRNIIFTSPSKKRRLVVGLRKVRHEVGTTVDHGPNSYGKRLEHLWVLVGSSFHARYIKKL